MTPLNGVEERQILFIPRADLILIVAKRSFLHRFAWWRDVRFYGAYPLSFVMIPAGVWGIYYEAIVLGKWICFHMFWGIGFLIAASGMLFFNTRRMRRFQELMRDGSTSHFLEHRKELEELVQELPNKHRSLFKQRLAAVTDRKR